MSHLYIDMVTGVAVFVDCDISWSKLSLRCFSHCLTNAAAPHQWSKKGNEPKKDKRIQPIPNGPFLYLWSARYARWIN